MLLLNTPLTIYPDSYPHMLPIKIELDVRTGTVNVFYAPIKTTASLVYLGVEEKNDAGTTFRYPDLVKSISIRQNLTHPDPTIRTILENFLTCMEDLDVYVAGQGVFETETIQIGTTVWSLANTVEAIGARVLTYELKDVRSALTPNTDLAYTVDPTVTIT